MQPLTRRAFLALGAVGLGAVGSLAGIAVARQNRPADRPGDEQVSLGGLTLVVKANPWRLSLLGPDGQALGDEGPDQTIGYRTADGQLRRAARLASFNAVSADVVKMVAETDDPAGGTVSF